MHYVTRKALIAIFAAASGLLALVWLQPFLPTAFSDGNYLGIHSFLELISIIVSFSLFNIVWISRDALEGSLGQSLIIVGISFFAVGSMDLLHVFTYQGATGYSGTFPQMKSIFLCLYARYLSVAAVAAMLIWPGRLNVDNNKLAKIALSTAIAAIGLALAVTYYWPAAWRPQNLPLLKSSMELLLILLYIVTLGLVRAKSSTLKDSVAGKIAYFLIFSLCSQASFTFFNSELVTYSLLGHIYKFISFLFLYQAVYLSGVFNHFYNLSEMAKMSAELLKESISLKPIMEIQAKKLKQILPKAQRISFYTTGKDPNHFIPSYQWGKYGEIFSHSEGVYINNFQKLFGQKVAIYNSPIDLLLNNLSGDYSLQLVPLFKEAKQILYLPLAVEGRFHGFIMVYIFCKANSFDEDDMERAELFQTFAALAIAQVRHQELVTRLSYEDGMTGLPNRRRFFEEIEKAVYAYDRYKTPFTVIYLDMNNLKYINDTFGHDAGDEALLTIAAYLKKATRQSDLPARLGGDEFAILYPYMDHKSAQTKIAELKLLFANLQLKQADAAFSLAVGGASYPDEAADADTLLSLADDRMYKHKREMKSLMERTAG
ncbi:sensor domain-containing diguanylate cyclase [Anaerospora hongkongensis]|uniref:sensor domain-containing diguanylate cyclase n=1 Tax=Anaerospora hongkongensis TaxID=244830 RepID=UPI00289A9027|nr:diguanylate cyclase [Anaerospora hongkongensis]